VTGGWYQKAIITPQARPWQGERRMRKLCARWRFGSAQYLRIYLQSLAFERPHRAVRIYPWRNEASRNEISCIFIVIYTVIRYTNDNDTVDEYIKEGTMKENRCKE